MSRTSSTLRSSYELRPDTAVFFEGSVNERDYKQSVNSAGFRRGSSGTTLLAGAVVNFTNRLTGEISAGWGQQQSVDDRLSPVEGPLLNADLIWLPSPLTKLEFIARSEIDDTSLTDSLGAIDRYYDLRCSTRSGAISCLAATSRTKLPTMSTIRSSTNV